LNLIALAPYSLPGTVLALAIILAWVKPLPFLHFTLYNTPWIILFAYIARYLIFPVRVMSGAIAQVDDSMEESARASGAGWCRSIRDILLPLISRSVLVGWFLVFMPAFRELNLSILLWSGGNETVAVAVFNLTEAGDLTSAAALAVLLMIVVWMGNFITQRISGREFGL
jgi:iron(III) transport system permease protein